MSLTAANAVITLTIAGVFNAGQQLQQFAADDVFSVEQVTPTETLMGVDGFLSGGRTPVPVPWTISLQADSPSNFIFEQWFAAQETIAPCWLPLMTWLFLSALA